MIKRRNKIIVAILFLFLVLFPLGATTYAAINQGYGDNGAVIEGDLDGKMKNSAGVEFFASMIYALASWAESLVGSAFQLLTGSNMFPWADRVIFNTIPFLDINFLNPSEHSLFLTGEGKSTPLADIVVNVYSTVFTLAVTFLGVVVGLMAIKLAISSLASEKAKYKEALMKFLFSLVMLFAMHYAMSFIFYINESMVEMASKILTNNLGEATIALDLNVDRDVMVDNFIDKQGNWGGISVIWEAFTGIDASKEGIANIGADDAKAFIKNEDHPVVKIDKKEITTGSNKEIAGFLISNKATYCDIRIPTAFGGTDKGFWGNIGNFFWGDAGNKKDTIGKVYIDIVLVRSPETINMFKDVITKVNNFSEFKKTNYFKAYYNRALETEVKKINLTMEEFYASDKEHHIIKQVYMIMEEREKQIWAAAKEEAPYYKTLINAHEIYYTREREPGSNPTSLLADMGQFFKDSAWTYETNDEGDIKGWYPSEITLQGAILYAMFVIQSIMFFFAYIKRFFYVVILALLAPIIVIYDFLGKVAS